jgi:hypothetical protein
MEELVFGGAYEFDKDKQEDEECQKVPTRVFLRLSLRAVGGAK